ncbi:hypothetical protein P154DRAFT_451075 [Amniculicola lignicola CBS 123094]|uniref:Uncharacterized protein n=1 Tax=Amniculicola lignicola CBS 123094 TaxID=1392246 RepID=A0A6A5W643_9PLEO|nr:hypothetical protein P154DRAFT_451075 [Amniculicola lignicola CBS 123094]
MFSLISKRKLGDQRQSDTVVVLTKSKFLGSGGSIVTRLKLKEINRRALLGVEPAA